MCFYCIVGNLIRDGRRLCTNCLYLKPIDDFKRRDVRRQDPTSMCTRCRDIFKKSSRKPTTLKGKCRSVWMKWKENRKCEDCGIGVVSVIESHHKDRTTKINKEALAKELAKCQALCRSCHRMKHRKPGNKGKKANALFVDAERLKVGECQCGCGEKVTRENVLKDSLHQRSRQST